MGFPYKILLELYNCGVAKGADIGDCGSQDFAASQIAEVNNLLHSLHNAESFPVNEIVRAADVFRRAGYRYSCFDVDYREGTIYLDFHRFRFPRELYGKFDVTLNGGTSEHLVAPHGLFFFMHQATKVGGLMFHQVPVFGWGNHGFNNLTPKFWHQLATYNGYEIVSAQVDPVNPEHIDPNNFYGEHLSYIRNLKEFDTSSAIINLVFRKVHARCFIPPFDIDDPRPSPRTERLMRDALEPFVAAESLSNADIDHAMNSLFGRPDSAHPEISFRDCSLSVQAACDRAAELSAAGSRKDAISLWTSIRDRYPNHAEAAFQLGQLILDDAHAKADALYAVARRLDPKHPAYAAEKNAAWYMRSRRSGLITALRAKLRHLTS
jgi:hypothetical protein